MKTLHPGFAAIDEIALLAVPAILRKRVIVIDDIERKHAALSIDEVMGFIDEFTQVYGSRILLILNSDQLDDKAMWDKLREKVIDHDRLGDDPDAGFWHRHRRGAVALRVPHPRRRRDMQDIQHPHHPEDHPFGEPLV